MLDPGTALAILGLALNAVTEVYDFYSVCKERDDDVDEARRELLWLKTFFEATRGTLEKPDFDRNQIDMICASIESCEATIKKLEKRLKKVSRESPAVTVVQKMGDHGRRLLYPFQKGTIIRLLELIAKLRDQMHQAVSLLNLDTAAKTLEEVQEIKNLIIDNAQDVERRKVIEWLNPVDQSEIHASALRKHEPGTAEWFLGGSRYDEWKDGKGSALHLVGEAGCGKTVLFSSIVQRTQELSSPTTSGCFSAYFYCLYRKGAQHDLAPILRTLIAQLCPSDHIPSSLQELYDRHSKKFPPGIPSTEELKQTLLSIIHGLSKPTRSEIAGKTRPEVDVFVLIDALDELPEGHERKHIIKFFNELASFHIPSLHLLATSRNHHDISVGLGSWMMLPIDKKKVIEDIRLFVSHRLESNIELSQKNTRIKNEILHRIVDKGNGIPPTPRAIRQVLSSLPADLDETYERILTRIHAGNSKQAMNALRWISFATRPLFIEELIEACAIDLDETPEFDNEERFSPRNIMDLLPGLVTIDPPLKIAEDVIHGTHVVTFAHFSVQEYLTGQRIRSSPASPFVLDFPYSNRLIAACAIAYLFCCNTLRLRSEYYPLRSYAWDYWAWHASCESSMQVEEQEQAAEDLFQSVVQQKTPDGQVTVDELVTGLSSLIPWPAFTRKFGLQFENALRVPFFYPEFSVSEKVKSISFEYQYEPLQAARNEIRLIEIYSSPKNYTELRCKVWKVSLDSNPVYDGVSHHWGGPQTYGHVRANGLLLKVPKSLVSDLRNLRTKNGDRGRVIFVDALCFNQLASEERHPRVGLMPQIFKQAQQVAISLGNRRVDDASAITVVQRIASKSLTSDNASQLLRYGESYDDWALCLEKAVLQLIQRPWWRRIWPVQELVLPRKATLYYGDLATTFDDFQRFFEMGQTIRDIVGLEHYSKLVTDKAWIGVSRVSKIRTWYQSGGHHATLSELLWATQYHQPRDGVTEIFGLVGLLSVEDQCSPLLTGSKGLTVEERFTMVARYILYKHQNLDILSYASCHTWRKRAEDTTVPSWVPNFSVEGQDLEPLMKGGFGQIGSSDVYNAGRGSGALSYNISESTLQLTFQGRTLDRIETVLPPFEEASRNEHAQLLAQYQRIKEIGDRVVQPTSQTLYEVFWRTIHADQWQTKRLGDEDEQIVAIRTAQDDQLPEIHLAKHANNKFYEKRRLLVTSQGHLCLGPLYSKINDVIVIPMGGKVPYTLRYTGEACTLIGECYVHGMMDGDLFEASTNDTTKSVEDFRLI